MTTVASSSTVVVVLRRCRHRRSRHSRLLKVFNQSLHYTHSLAPELCICYILSGQYLIETSEKARVCLLHLSEVLPFITLRLRPSLVEVSLCVCDNQMVIHRT